MKEQIGIYKLILVLLGFGLFSIVYTGCKKSSDNNEETPSVPVLTTTAPTNITSTSATSGGNITSTGGGTITARGVCWSTSQNPTIADNKTSDGAEAMKDTSSRFSVTQAPLIMAIVYPNLAVQPFAA